MANYFKTKKTQIPKRLHCLVLLLFVYANFASLLSPAPLASLISIRQPTALYAQGQTDKESTLSAFSTVLAPQSTLITTELLNKWLDQQAQELLDQMNTDQKVGQLFVITFEGDHEQLAPDGTRNQLESFIQEYHIGGVVISSYHHNFINVVAKDGSKYVPTPMQVARLNTKLQATAYGWSLSDQQVSQILSGTVPLTQSLKFSKQVGDVSVHIPLLIAARQDGDGFPTTQLRSGFTPLPTQMALGSTWNPDLIDNVGEIVGRELSAVGVNLLLGPHLDILEQPRPDPVGKLGVHSFNGSPFWVSEMGKAYITGVHRGSAGTVATVARHFPGQGDVDRLPDQEVATIQRNEEELQQFTLYPFKSVTHAPPMPLFFEKRMIGADSALGNDLPDELLSEFLSEFLSELPSEQPSELLSITDGLMSSHMRYSAIQGRETPLSLSTELQELLEQEAFAPWHQGGVVMSNALGVSAIRNYYDPTLTQFPFLQAAVEAFTAGNNLLYIDRFSNDISWDATRSNVRETIKLFRRRYVEDSDFAALVDQSVHRILRLKLRLYGNPSQEDLAALQEPVNDLPAIIAETDDGAANLPAAEGQNNEGEQNINRPNFTQAVDEDIASENKVNAQGTAEIIPLKNVLIRPEQLAQLQDSDNQSTSEAVIRKVARQSISLLHSASEDYVPGADAQVLIFTDSRFVEECRECEKRAMVASDTIADIIIRLYGPKSTARFKATQINSATFSDLSQLLAESELADDNLSRNIPGNVPPEPGESTTITENMPTEPSDLARVGNGNQSASIDTSELKDMIDTADWLIFAMLDVDSESEPDSTALKRFLSQRGEEVREKNLVVFALNAPYFLDATEISKLTVYFGVSSKIQPFLEAAVRALFEGYTLDGSPAVSIPGTRYRDLAERLAPYPDQSITLKIYNQQGTLLADTSLDNENGEPTLLVPQNVSLNLVAGPIIDFNKQPVADGTEVLFTFDYPEEDGRSEFSKSSIQQGSATGRLERLRAGTLQISASSGEAVSEAIILKIEAPILVPTEIPEKSPILIPTRVPTKAPTATFTDLFTETAIAIDRSVTVTATATLVPPDIPSSTVPSTLPATLSSTVESTQPKTTIIPADEVPADEPPVTGFTTLVAALSVMLLSLTLFVTATLRVLPKKTLVHHTLWAVNVGLGVYVLYALRLIPGLDGLHRYLSIWDGAILVLSTMLLTLLWLQLRSHD